MKDLHEGKCDMPHIIPMILFMVWTWHRTEVMTVCAPIEVVTFADWWELLQSVDVEGYPYFTTAMSHWVRRVGNPLYRR